MDSARTVFLRKGYHGTRIDDIAEEAGLSRASFYSYFPSKRDLLIELGRRTSAAMEACLDEIDLIASRDGTDMVHDIVRAYLRLLDEHGAFLLVWGQATFEDPKLARAGMRTRLVSGRRFGQILQKVAGVESSGDDDPARFGLALLVMIDRYWSYWRVNDFPFDEQQVVATLGDICLAVIDSLRRS
jgi:AcrR family transcriptional regulator